MSNDLTQAPDRQTRRHRSLLEVAEGITPFKRMFPPTSSTVLKPPVDEGPDRFVSSLLTVS